MKINDPVTMMFTDRIKPEKLGEYEAWTKGIHHDAKQFEGFISADVIYSEDKSNPEYIVLIKFDSQQNINFWLHSDNVRMWTAQLEDFLLDGPNIQQASGLELWFTRPKSPVSAKPPPFYKQVVLGVITVYPMIIILNFLLRPITGSLPWALSLFISVVILSTLLTYPVMPFASKLLKNWLYPKDRT